MLWNLGKGNRLVYVAQVSKGDSAAKDFVAVAKLMCLRYNITECLKF
jgi:hypothetical protein